MSPPQHTSLALATTALALAAGCGDGGGKVFAHAEVFGNVAVVQVQAGSGPGPLTYTVNGVSTTIDEDTEGTRHATLAVPLAEIKEQSWKVEVEGQGSATVRVTPPDEVADPFVAIVGCTGTRGDGSDEFTFRGPPTADVYGSCRVDERGQIELHVVGTAGATATIGTAEVRLEAIKDNLPQRVTVPLLAMYGAASSWGTQLTGTHIALSVNGESVGEAEVRAPADDIIDRVLRSVAGGTPIAGAGAVTAVVEKAGAGGWLTPDGKLGAIGRVAITEAQEPRVARTCGPYQAVVRGQDPTPVNYDVQLIDLKVTLYDLADAHVIATQSLAAVDNIGDCPFVADGPIVVPVPRESISQWIASAGG